MIVPEIEKIWTRTRTENALWRGLSHQPTWELVESGRAMLASLPPRKYSTRYGGWRIVRTQNCLRNREPRSTHTRLEIDSKLSNTHEMEMGLLLFTVREDAKTELRHFESKAQHISKHSTFIISHRSTNIRILPPHTTVPCNQNRERQPSAGQKSAHRRVTAVLRCLSSSF